MKKILFAISILSSLLFSLALVPATQAQSVRTMTVSPPRVELQLAPGETHEGIIKLINDSSEALTFDVIMQDFIVDNNNGIPNILPVDSLSNKYSASTWIGLEAQELTVPARTRQELSYYVQVPLDAKPGGHYAAVIYSPVLADAGRESTGTTVNSQIGTLFYVTVEGPITEKADVTLFDAKRFNEYGPIDLKTQIRNLGDNHVMPKGYVTVSNMFGKQSYMVSLENRNIFPERGLDYKNEFGKKWMFGRYKAELTATYGLNNNLPLTASFYFWVIPWKIILLIIFLIVAAVLGGVYVNKKRQTTDHNVPPQA